MDSLAPPKKRAPFIRQFELIERVKDYDPTADEALLNRAYVYAMRMHGAQLRASGDPYFAHPIEVSGILTEYKLDTATIVTGLLHDVIEDTAATRDDIEGLFGEEVAELVEGVTKLSRLELQSDRVRQAENLRKFILAISKDVRVLLVKLADRLHNMRTLGFVSPAKRERISRETLDIYAPLARAIGCHRFALELEELSFEHLNPKGRDAILRRLEELRKTQGPMVGSISASITSRLEKEGISARVFGREKNPYSIWRKLQRKSVGFAQLSDIFAFRVIVDTEEDCYRALGVVHRTWPCVPARFKDFISTPKQNNYRSLHTTVVGGKGQRVEMQIRTEDMDHIAEEGVAAHWRYKNQSYSFDAEAAEASGGKDPLDNLRRLVEVIEHGGDPEDYLENAKLELFVDQVFVFTPKGNLIRLPRGAMPLDFAYALHTNIGDTTIGAKINGELRALHTPLQNGDLVEIIRGDAPQTLEDWRSLTITGKARSAIRRRIRSTERVEFIRVGRSAVEQVFERVGRTLQGVSLRPALENAAVTHEDELFLAVGRGGVPPIKVLQLVHPGLGEEEIAAATERSRIHEAPDAHIYVQGGGLTPGIGVHLGQCCTPVPGDRIVGLMEPGVGLTVHTIDCERLGETDEQAENWIDLQWSPEAGRTTLSSAKLRLNLRNAPGVLGQVCVIIGEARGNIINMKMGRRQLDFFEVDFDVEVTDAKHLIHLQAALRANPAVEAVQRIRG